MKVAIILALGESWEEFKARGQDELFMSQRLKPYSKHFDYVYLFSYGKKSMRLLPNVELIGNSSGWNRFIYALLLTLIHRHKLALCNIIRGMQLTSVIPLIITKYLLRKKVVINYGYDYSEVARGEGKFIRSKLFSILKQLTLPLVDAVIVTTPTLRQQVNKLIKENVCFIPNGVNTKLFSPVVKQIDKNIILFIGRLELQKNLSTLVRAVSRLTLSNQLLFIGTGSLKDELNELAKSLNVNLKIKDFVPHHKLNKYYQQARLFVLPSLIEGHPKVLLEAMSVGLPVVGTNVEGIRDVIRHNYNGILVDNSEKSIAKAIETLLMNKDLSQRLGKEARQTIINKYDISKLSIREIKLLKKICSL